MFGSICISILVSCCQDSEPSNSLDRSRGEKFHATRVGIASGRLPVVLAVFVRDHDAILKTHVYASWLLAIRDWVNRALTSLRRTYLSNRTRLDLYYPFDMPSFRSSCRSLSQVK